MANNKRRLKDIMDENPDYDGIVLFDNPSYDTAFIGLTQDNIAVYDYDKMVEWLMEHENMTASEAMEFIDYNASYRWQDNQPIIVTMPSDIADELC